MKELFHRWTGPPVRSASVAAQNAAIAAIPVLVCTVQMHSVLTEFICTNFIEYSMEQSIHLNSSSQPMQLRACVGRCSSWRRASSVLFRHSAHRTRFSRPGSASASRSTTPRSRQSGSTRDVVEEEWDWLSRREIYCIRTCCWCCVSFGLRPLLVVSRERLCLLVWGFGWGRQNIYNLILGLILILVLFDDR